MKDHHHYRYNPEKFDIFLFDQRGCGQSRSAKGPLHANTTPQLVEDIEKLRKMAGHDKWWVFGSSWGSTLALAYAETQPERVSGLVLSGIFTGTRAEVDWLHEGAKSLFPEAYTPYHDYIPTEEADDLVKAYARRILDGTSEERLKAAKTVGAWEGRLSVFEPPETWPPEMTPEEEQWLVDHYRIFFHYEINRFFMEEGQLFRKLDRIRNIPGHIVQGRFDVVCPPITAWKLHKNWPASTLEIVHAAGHTSSEPALGWALRRTLDNLKG